MSDQMSFTIQVMDNILDDQADLEDYLLRKAEVYFAGQFSSWDRDYTISSWDNMSCDGRIFRFTTTGEFHK